jgi:uncharacterized protein YwgA
MNRVLKAFCFVFFFCYLLYSNMKCFFTFSYILSKKACIIFNDFTNKEKNPDELFLLEIKKLHKALNRSCEDFFNILINNVFKKNLNDQDEYLNGIIDDRLEKIPAISNDLGIDYKYIDTYIKSKQRVRELVSFIGSFNILKNSEKVNYISYLKNSLLESPEHPFSKFIRNTEKILLKQCYNNYVNGDVYFPG